MVSCGQTRDNSKYIESQRITAEIWNQSILMGNGALDRFPTLFTRDFITKTSLFKYTEKFTAKKWKISDKNSDIIHISAQNIDCVYSLEPPRRGGSNEYPQSMFWACRKKKIMYTPVNPSFTI